MVTVIMRLITGEWSYGAAAIDTFLLMVLFGVVTSAGEEAARAVEGQP